MRVISTDHRLVDVLSRQVRDNLLLIRGPEEKLVVVMSYNEFRRRYAQEQPHSIDDVSSSIAQCKPDNVLQIANYIHD